MNDARANANSSPPRRQTAPRSTIVVAVMTASVLSACTPKSFAPPPQALRDDIDRIELNVSVAPQLQLREPVSGAGEGALTGAAQGAGGSLYVGASMCQAGDALSCAVGLALGIIVAPVAAVVGAGVGAAKARPTKDVEHANRAIRAALDQSDVKLGLERALLDYGQGIRPDWLVPGETDSNSQPDESSEDSAAISHVLDLTVSEYRFVPSGRFDPDIFISATVSARIARRSEAADLYRRSWKYKGPTDGFFVLAKHDAGQLRSRMNGSYQTIARRVFDDLFISSTPEQLRPGQTAIWTIEAPEYHPKSEPTPAGTWQSASPPSS